MDGIAIVNTEAFLYSADFGEDSYLLASSSSESEPECCCSASSYSTTEDLEQKRPRLEGFVEVMVPQLSVFEFKANFRVTSKTCKKIAELLNEEFNGNHGGGWKGTSPLEATYIFLWYLGSKKSYKQISDKFNITQSRVHNIIKLVCESLAAKYDKFIKWPDLQQCEDMSNSFCDICNIPKIIGAVNVSHIEILKPKDHEIYVNSRNYHSIAVQGVIASNMKFIDLYMSEGSKQPIEILKESPVMSLAENESLGEYFLLGSNAYHNLQWLVTPFHNAATLTAKQKEFNQCHEFGYHITYDAFGLLKDRFQRLNHMENKDMQFTQNCVRAVCVVHNICIELGDEFESLLPDEGIFDEKIQFKDEDSDDGKRTERFAVSTPT